MNLSARERQALRSIEGGLSASDPDLVAKMGKLSRLMVEGDIPAAERRRASWRQLLVLALVRWLPHSRGRGRTRRRSRWVSAMMVLWLAVSCAMIATAAALSHVAKNGACAAIVPVDCGTQSPAGHPQPGAR